MSGWPVKNSATSLRMSSVVGWVGAGVVGAAGTGTAGSDDGSAREVAPLLCFDDLSSAADARRDEEGREVPGVADGLCDVREEACAPYELGVFPDWLSTPLTSPSPSNVLGDCVASARSDRCAGALENRRDERHRLRRDLEGSLLEGALSLVAREEDDEEDDELGSRPSMLRRTDARRLRFDVAGASSVDISVRGLLVDSVTES